MGTLYKAEFQSQWGWSQVGYYETVAAFEELYSQLRPTNVDVVLDIHEYVNPATGDHYRLRPIIFLREG